MHNCVLNALHRRPHSRFNKEEAVSEKWGGESAEILRLSAKLQRPVDYTPCFVAGSDLHTP